MNQHQRRSKPQKKEEKKKMQSNTLHIQYPEHALQCHRNGTLTSIMSYESEPHYCSHVVCKYTTRISILHILLRRNSVIANAKENKLRHISTVASHQSQRFNMHTFLCWSFFISFNACALRILLLTLTLLHFSLFCLSFFLLSCRSRMLVEVACTQAAMGILR